MKRSAFTLVELIVMIVVLGIAFATLPMILGVSAESVRSVSEVRGVYHGVAKMQVVVGKPWDESNVQDYEDEGHYYALRTTESDEPAETLYCENNKSRGGHYPGLDRRMCESDNAAAIGTDLGETGTNDLDDIDDFNGDSETVEGLFDVNTTVRYVDYRTENVNGIVTFNPADLAAAGTSNIKEIIVTVSDHWTGKVVSGYRYYAANIGLAKPYIKRND